MAEPQPPSVHEGASTPPLPPTAEARKAAAALSALSTEDAGAKKEVNGKALDKAMQGLNIGDKNKGEEEKKKNIKVEAVDVQLLVSELEVSKQKATELIRANEGDVVKALTAYVMARP